MSIPTSTTPTSLFAPTTRMTLRASCPAATDLLVLANRTRLRFRPISPDDHERLARLFARLTPESRYRRFLSPKRQLTPQEPVYLTDIDHVTQEAIAAVDQRDGSIVGVGRYAQFADRVAVADVAFMVADELQGMGIGTVLASLPGGPRPRERLHPPDRHDPVGEPAGARYCDACGSAPAQATVARSSSG
jgi:hypothetical protein